MKIPIFLLYVVSLGLAAGSGLIFYEALKVGSPEEIKQRWEAGRKMYEAGANLTPQDRTWSYVPQEWWTLFSTVNFTGKLPPPPVVEAPPTPVDDKPKGVTPIDEILTVIGIVHAPQAEGPRSSRAIVRYKPSANVQVPPELLASSAPTFANRPVTAAPGRGGPQTAMPTFDPNQTPLHHVLLEQTLWKPFDNIRLVRIADDARQVWFLREDPSKPREEWKEEVVYKNEMELPRDVIEQLVKWSGEEGPARRSSGSGARSAGGSAPADGVRWQDVAETTEVAPGNWMMSEKDYTELSQNLETVLNEEVYAETYTAPSANIRGVWLKNVSSPALRRLGITGGEVLLSINGVPVKGKSEAIKVGRDMWDRGTRTFTGEFLVKGRRETRTITFPRK